MNALAHVWIETPGDWRRAVVQGFGQPGRATDMSAAGQARANQDFEPAGLILAIAARADREAFTLLFNHFAPRVKGYLMRLGASAVAAEELAQETLLMVWRKAAQFDPARAGASTWIFTIARNLRIDALRRDRPARAAEDPSDATSEPQADGLILAAERDQRVRGALKALSREQAQIVELSFFSEETHAAIAQRLGLPLGTVKSRLRLAMGRMRALLEDMQ